MYHYESVKVFYLSASVNIPRQWSTQIECFSHPNLSLKGASVYCPNVLLIVSKLLLCVEVKVACSEKWITLFWFGWYSIVFFFFSPFGTALLSLSMKSVPSWLTYEERSFLSCSKTFLCFCDLSEFDLGQYWHPFCTCVTILHFKTKYFFFFFPWSGCCLFLLYVSCLGPAGSKSFEPGDWHSHEDVGCQKAINKLSYPSDFVTFFCCCCFLRTARILLWPRKEPLFSPVAWT